jgi:catechol 2,3-dioxygenase
LHRNAGDLTRLPGETRIGAVRLQIADLARSLEYYRDHLGFAVLSTEHGIAVLGSAAAARPLITLHERRGARPVPHAGVLGLFHVAILLPDRASLGRVGTHLAAAGVRVASADHHVSEALYLWDPDGLGLEVYADRPRSEWQVRDGELVMVTEPLDLASLARAGGGEPWTGVPAGTTVGHVHLQVGDLAAARAFYHEGLGFDITVSRYPGALFMSAGGYHHHVAVNTWAPNPRPATDADARLLEWELLVPGGGPDRVLIDPWGTPVRVRAA